MLLYAVLHNAMALAGAVMTATVARHLPAMQQRRSRVSRPTQTKSQQTCEQKEEMI